MNEAQPVPTPSISRSHSFPPDVAAGRASTPTRGMRESIFSTVAALWDALNHQRLARQNGPNRPVYFNPAEVAVNETRVACLNNVHVLHVDTEATGSATKPIHAHAVGIPPNATDSTVTTTDAHYAAGQSPSASAYLDVVLQGVVSGHGIFQFVSPKAHNHPDTSRETPIIGLLREAIAERAGDNPLVVGGRYEVTDFKAIAGKGFAGQPDDYLRYALTVIDRHSGTSPPRTITVPITQAGLKFSGALLASGDIVRANDLLEEHQQAGHRRPTEGATASVTEQLILSRAGFGRNATLITYRKICDRIARGSITEANLMDVLHDEIDAGRQQREPHYVHSMPQLNELHAALLRHITHAAVRPARREQTHPFDFESLVPTSHPPIVIPITEPAVEESVDRSGNGENPHCTTPATQATPDDAAGDAAGDIVADTAVDSAVETASKLQAPKLATETEALEAGKTPEVPVGPPEEISATAIENPNNGNVVATPVATPPTQPAVATAARPGRMTRVSHSLSHGMQRAFSGARSVLKGGPHHTQRFSTRVAERTPADAQTRQRSRSPSPAISDDASDEHINQHLGIRTSDLEPRDVLDIGTVKSVITEEAFGKIIHRLGPGAVDINYIDDKLNKVVRVENANLVKNISGAAANCWWRAAWMLVLIKHAELTHLPETHLENLLIQKLGPDCANDAKKITQMVHAIREKGFHTVLTNMTHANLAADLASESRLKLPGMADEKGTIEAETICSSLTSQLLAQANVPYEIYGASVFDNEMGGDALIAVLCSELQTDMVIFSRPWKDGKMDVEHSSLAICTQPQSNFKFVEKSAENPQKLAVAIFNHALEDSAVIIHKGSHFNVSLPSKYIAKCRYPT